MFFRSAPRLTARRVPTLLVKLNVFAPRQRFRLRVSARLIYRARHDNEEAPKIRTRVIRAVFFRSARCAFPENVIREDVTNLKRRYIFGNATRICKFTVGSSVILANLCFTRARDYTFLVHVKLTLCAKDRLAIRHVGVKVRLVPRVSVLARGRFFLSVDGKVNRYC